MDTSNWRPNQGGSDSESGDWRSQLQPDSRERIVNKILDTLKRHLPYSGYDGLQELNRIAVRFEDKIYTAATSQSDYLRKISLKMLTMETRSQNPMQDAMQSYSTANSVNPSHQGLRPIIKQEMDTSNWRPTEGGSAGDADDWRSQLQADSRQRIVNKILDTLKRHLPFSGHEGLLELNKIAVRFEDKIYAAATSQSDYLRKLSLKVLTIETRSHNPMPDARQSYFTANSVNPSNPGLNSIIRQEMDMSNWRPTQGGSASGGGNDWRSQLQADSRERIVNKIIDTLKRHLQYSGHEGLQELNEIAARFEDKIYAAATSQSDYLRTISLKMLTMTGPQNPMPDTIQSYSTANSVNP